MLPCIELNTMARTAHSEAPAHSSDSVIRLFFIKFVDLQDGASNG